MNEQLIKTSGADVSSSWKKLKKTSEFPTPLPFYVRGLSHRDGIWKKVDDFPGKTKVLTTKTKKRNDIKLKINKKIELKNENISALAPISFNMPKMTIWFYFCLFRCLTLLFLFTPNFKCSNNSFPLCCIISSIVAETSLKV